MARRPNRRVDPLSGAPEETAGRDRAEWGTAVAAGLILLALVVGTFTVLVPGGDDETDESATPGFGDSIRAVDETQFEFAQPTTTAGPTTIAGLAGPDDEDEDFDFATTTTSTTTTTTTPPGPPELFVPATADITSICGMYRSAVSFFSQGDPGFVLRTYSKTMTVNLDRWVEVAPSEVAADAAEVRDVMQSLIRLWNEGGRRLDYPPAATIVQGLSTGSSPYEHMADVMSRLAAYERANCERQ